jgi:hypothetical protein
MDPGLWFVNWFFWSCRILDKLFPPGFEYREVQYQNGTNICHFFRTLLFGMTALSLVLAWYMLLFFVGFVLPFILFHASSIGFAIFIMGCVVVAGVIIVATVFGIIKLGAMYLEYRREQMPHEPSNKPSFLTLAYLYLKAWKERYCLIIEFKPEVTPSA